MKVLDAIFKEDEDQSCLGQVYNDLLLKDQGLFMNPFLIYSRTYMKDKWNMVLNYSQRSNVLLNLNSLVFNETLKENFYSNYQQ